MMISSPSEGRAALILRVQFSFPQFYMNDSKGNVIFVLLRTKVNVLFLKMSSCYDVQWTVIMCRAEADTLQPVEVEIDDVSLEKIY